MAIFGHLCVFSEENYQKRMVLVKIGPFETNEHFLGQKRAFQANIASMKQKSHVINLFWLQLNIFWTREGCLRPKNDYFGQKCAFKGVKH
jgi:hypothetical protein